MSSSPFHSPPSESAAQAVPCEIQTLLREYLTSARLAEIVYRDEAGQIQTTHDRIRDLFSRAGQDFVYLGRGQMLRLDHLLTLEGRPVIPLFQP
jgi:Rho-binding antiterminator